MYVQNILWLLANECAGTQPSHLPKPDDREPLPGQCIVTQVGRVE